jgi:hypothetical protein
MKSNKRLKQSLNRFSNKKQNKEEIYSGELGIPQNGRKIVEVPGRAGYVYARLLTNKNELIQALNTSVAAIYGLPVKIRRVKNTYTVIGKEYTRYSNQGSGVGGGVIPLPRHGGQHSLNPDLNMGSDPTWVYSRQIMHMLAYPSGTTSMMLGLSPGFYQYNNQWVYPQVTGVPSFASYVPTVTGAARMALYYLDGADNGLKISAGALFSGGITDPQLLAAYIPTPPASAIPLMAVKLRTGTTSLDWSNLYDARPWLQILPTGSTGGTSLNIQDEGVPLGTATILNFVGTPVSVTVSGTVANIFITGSTGGSVNPPITGSMVIWDDGITQGSALHLNFGSNITATISGSTAQIDVIASTGHILIVDQKAQNTPGGTFTQGAWQTRDLNTEIYDTGGHASISSNEIVLAAGTYRTEIECPAYGVTRHQARLYDVTNAAVLGTGTSEYTYTSNTVSNKSIIKCRFTLTGTTTIRVEHQCQTTKTTNGFGIECNFTDEIFTLVELWRE